MPKLVIDDREIDVAAGTMVIEAAARLGIMIPRFCYHPALGSVGACRVCAVKFVDGPVKGIQMSCMVAAQEGMVVSTTDEEALDFRKHIIEWLMVNHPHDCPVCDEGGHCLLQDMTVSGGHGIRRFAGNKRTYADQYLGPLIQHEMNRCIHCYRCSRYYQEFTGFYDLGVMGIANRTYYGRFQDGVLQSPFSGNLSDICPTGVYTDKPSRYFGRRWDYQRSPSICINCCLGCNTIGDIRYREIKRQEARCSENVNGYFICDRGRYGFFYAGDSNRPRRARIKNAEVSVEAALETVRETLAGIHQAAGASAVATVGSLRSSLETQALLKEISRVQGWRDPVFFGDSALTRKVKTVVGRLEPQLTVSMRRAEKADFVLVVGADPINEAPMLALALRQAQRNGAKVVVLDPRPIALPLEFVHLAVTPSDLGPYIGLFIKGLADRDTAGSLGQDAVGFYDVLSGEDRINPGHAELVAAAIADLLKSERPLVVCGTDIVPDTLPHLAADCALFWQAAGKAAGLFYLLPGANGFGAGLLSDSDASLEKIIEAIENGSVKALIVSETDLYQQFGDSKRLERAVEALDLMIVLDYIDTKTAGQAHVFIPSTTIYESGGIFINQEGRVQYAGRAFGGGLPIAQNGGGDHPPRVYGTGIPEAQPAAAWRTLAKLTDAKAAPDESDLPASILQRLTELIPEFGGIQSLDDLYEEGIHITAGAQAGLRFTGRDGTLSQPRQDEADGLELILVDWTFGTEELSSLSACLQELEPEPAVFMHVSEAARLNLSDGNRVAIETQSGRLEVNLRVVENMASGVLVIPRHRKLAWRIFETGVSSIIREKIKRVEA